jgi:diguanylate cyclase (GGDEF)-like protein
MIPDIQPFWLIGALGAFGCGLLVLIVRKAYPEHLGRVLSLWGAANICLGAAYAVRLARSWEGPLVFHVLGSSLFVACLSLELLAVRVLKRQPVSRGWIAAPSLLTAAVCLWFTAAQKNITIELIVFNFVNMTLMILIARSLVRAEDGRRRFADLVTAGAYALLGVAACLVIFDYFRVGSFSPEYDFNRPRSIFNGVTAILAEGTIFPLFLLMLSERLNRDLVVQAMRDPLTGLYNRRAFEEIAFRELAGAARTGLGLAVVLIDIDHFKQVNDKYGHAAGDAALISAASTLRHCLRNEDFLGRWGGDEFCALLPRAGRQQAREVVERMLLAFEDFNLQLDGKLVKIAVSMGVVTEDGDTKDFFSLVVQADAALYRAKEMGRKGFAFALDENREPEEAGA